MKILFFLLRSLAKYTSPILKGPELLIMKRYVSNTFDKDPVFIVGAPRTGSTILYQLLTSNYQFAYINNFISLFHRNLFLGFYLNTLFSISRKGHDCFTSVFGNTLHCGWNGPNESGNFWYNWIDKKTIFQNSSNPDKTVVEGIAAIFKAVTKFVKKPLLIKNLYSGQRLPLIKAISPNAKIIYIKRDPLFTAQSILKARKKLNIPKGQIWSVKPAQMPGEVPVDEIALVVKQIFYIQKQIEQDLILFQPEQVYTIDYLQIKEKLNDVFRFCEVESVSSSNLKGQINCNEKTALPPDELAKLQQELKKYSW